MAVNVSMWDYWCLIWTIVLRWTWKSWTCPLTWLLQITCLVWPTFKQHPDSRRYKKQYIFTLIDCENCSSPSVDQLIDCLAHPPAMSIIRHSFLSKVTPRHHDITSTGLPPSTSPLTRQPWQPMHHSVLMAALRCMSVCSKVYYYCSVPGVCGWKAGRRTECVGGC